MVCCDVRRMLEKIFTTFYDPYAPTYNFLLSLIFIYMDLSLTYLQYFPIPLPEDESFPEQSPATTHYYNDRP